MIMQHSRLRHRSLRRGSREGILQQRLAALRRISISTFALAGLALAPFSVARAQAQSGTAGGGIEVSGSYSLVRANASGFLNATNMQGGSAAVAYNLRDSLAVVADAGSYRFPKPASGLKATMYTYLFGPRITVHRTGRYSVFAQALVGGARLNASVLSIQAGENSIAAAAGLGMNIRVGHRWTIRAPEVDYLLTRFGDTAGAKVTQNNVRFSAGIVMHIGSY